jgi:S-methylmethionine-dependent homocysteine/selenocysteine methylase
MAQRKKFNVDDFVKAVREKLKNRGINYNDFNRLSSSYLNSAAEIIEKHHYDHARAFLEGKFNIDKVLSNDENKEVLAIRDLVELVKEHADTRTFGSYLIRSIKSILKTHQEEGN